MSKVSRKLNLLLILSVGLSVILSSLFVTVYLSRQFKKNNIENNMFHLDGLVHSIEAFLEKAAILNYQLSMNREIVDTILNSEPDWDRRVKDYAASYNTWIQLSDNSGQPLLTSMQQNYNFVELLFILDSAGNQSGRSYGPIGKRGDHWWYKTMTDDKEYSPFITHSYFSSTGYKPVASIFHPIRNDDTFVGIMGMDINFLQLQKLIESYIDSSSMYAIITDMKGVIMAHPQVDKIDNIYNLIKMTRSVLSQKVKGSLNTDGYLFMDEASLDWPDEISRAVSSAIAGEKGYLENIHVDGEISNLYYAPVPLSLEGNRGENYAVLLVHNRSDIINARKIIFLYISLFILIIVTVLFLLFRKQFSKNILIPLDTLIQSMNTMDFQNFKEIQMDTGDEFSLLARTYNDLNKKLIFTNNQLLEKLESLHESEAGYRAIAEIGLAISTEKNIDDLLELILKESMKQTHADGGTLYSYDSEAKQLDFKILHTESMNFHMGGSSGNPITMPPVPLFRDGKDNHSNVSSYAALTGDASEIERLSLVDEKGIT